MTFILGSLLLLGTFQTPAAALGIFQDMVFYQYSGGYAVISQQESSLFLLDPNGKVRAQYAQKGQGPNELADPVYLGFYKGHHLVLTQNRFLIAFNEQLEPQANAFAPLDPAIADTAYVRGLVNDKGLFWIRSGWSLEKNTVTQMAYGPKGWTVQSSFFPQLFHDKNAPRDLDFYMKMNHNEMLDVQGNTGFKTSLAVSMEEDAYHVEVFPDLSNDKDFSMVLSADMSAQIQSTPRLPIRAFIIAGYIFPDGYAVSWLGLAHPGDTEPESHLDSFNRDGGFKKRTVLESPIFPCVNSQEAFTFKEIEGKEVLVRLQSLGELEKLCQ